jgi:hypothetical protein
MSDFLSRPNCQAPPNVYGEGRREQYIHVIRHGNPSRRTSDTSKRRIFASRSGRATPAPLPEPPKILH